MTRTVREEAVWSRASSPASTGLHAEARLNIKYPQEPGIRTVLLAQVDKWTSLFQLQKTAPHGATRLERTTVCFYLTSVFLDSKNLNRM